MHCVQQASCKFSRKVALRAVGHNTSTSVTTYIESQVTKEQFVDKKFAESIQCFTHKFEQIDPNDAITVTRGRYWYHLHLVFVHAERYRFREIDTYSTVYDSCLVIAKKNGYQLSAISVMPDHVHLGVIGGGRSESRRDCIGVHE